MLATISAVHGSENHLNSEPQVMAVLPASLGHPWIAQV